MSLVNHFLEHSAARTPNKMALVCGGQRYTYAQIDEQSNRLAQALRAGGICRGDRVILFLPNSAELVVGIFAVLKLGAVLVVINSSTKPRKLRYLIDDAAAKGIISSARSTPTIRQIVDAGSSLVSVVIAGRDATAIADGCNEFVDLARIYEDFPNQIPSTKTIDQDLACLIYTSGSSGPPKGVMSSHANVTFASASIITYLGNVADDIVICPLPLSFDYGLYQLLMTFRFGGTLILEPSFAYPGKFLKLLESERVTGLPGVPTFFSILLSMDLSAYDFSNLRYLTNTAAALPPAQIERLQGAFPSTQIFSMYGLTETKRTLYLPPDQLNLRPDSVGIAIPGTEVWLEDEEGNRLGPNTVGELVIRGSHVMRGYWNSDEATRQRFRPGSIPGERYCYSGDLCRMDEDGYYYFVSRKDDIIKSRGEKVSPKEIENVLYQIPSVTEAAVIGVPDEHLGQAIKAIVAVNDESVTRKDILRHCRSQLEDFMLPKYVEIVDALPKTHSGKIQKRELI